MLQAETINTLAKNFWRRLPLPSLTLLRKVDVQFGANFEDVGEEMALVHDAPHGSFCRKSLKKFSLNRSPKLIRVPPSSLNAEKAFLRFHKGVLFCE